MFIDITVNDRKVTLGTIYRSPDELFASNRENGEIPESVGKDQHRFNDIEKHYNINEVFEVIKILTLWLQSFSGSHRLNNNFWFQISRSFHTFEWCHNENHYNSDPV